MFTEVDGTELYYFEALLLSCWTTAELPVKARAEKIKRCAKRLQDKTADKELKRLCKNVIKSRIDAWIVETIELTTFKYLRLK